jgi:hypothetical protein
MEIHGGASGKLIDHAIEVSPLFSMVSSSEIGPPT